MSPVQFDASYESAFRDHVARAGEGTLRAAYELGREAVGRGLSLLDLAEVHHAALLSQVRLVDVEAETIVRAAGEFLLESISAYEMLQRGFEETRQAALLQRSRLEMLRQLSGFLTDTSLASVSPESLQEVLRLLAEHAREFIGARVCVVSLNGEDGLLQASSHSASEPDGSGEPEIVHLSAVAVPSNARAERMIAPLISLAGKELGCVELIGKEEGDFTAVDRAALLHLSQMGSAAVERIRLHMTRDAED